MTKDEGGRDEEKGITLEETCLGREQEMMILLSTGKSTRRMSGELSSESELSSSVKVPSGPAG